jgi:hypothetical protein
MTTLKKWSAKDPNDIRDYWFDWSLFLADGVTITASTITIAAGITKVDDDFEDTRTRFRVSGGTIGNYAVTNLVVVSTGEQFEVTKILKVKERAEQAA